MCRIKEHLKRFYWKAATKQLDGIGIIEIILILVIIIGLILIFRNQIEAIMSKAFDFITNDSNEINTTMEIPTP
jgi:uncharacterized membrane protein